MPFRYTQNRDDAERKLVSDYMALAKHEPQLLKLLTDIMEAQPTSDDWYMNGWRRRVVELVGWHRKDNPVLGTSRAYDVVYRLCYSYLHDGETA